MSELQLRGRLFHMPGPWGAAVPAAGAGVKIVDLHPIKGTHQTIWTGTANGSGQFSGKSRNWKDEVVLVPAQPSRRLYPGGPVIPGSPAIRGPDPTDVLMLIIQVTVGGQTYSYPFPFIGDNVEVPVVLPFAPPGYNPNANRALLNGKEISDQQALFDGLVDAIQKRQNIELKLYGGWSEAAKPIADVIRDTPLKRARRVFPNSRAGSLVIVVGGVSITISAGFLVAASTLVLAIAAAILLAGVSVFIVCLGITVILAVLAGYQGITAEQVTVTNTDGTTTTETRIGLINANA